MRNRFFIILCLAFLAMTVSAQEKGVRRYNTVSTYAQAEQWTGNDLLRSDAAEQGSDLRSNSV